MSGRGLGWAMWATAGGNGGTSNPIASVGGAFTSPTNPVTQLLHHVNFPAAVMTNGNPPISWTTGHYATTGGPAKLTYPATGFVPIRMIYGCSGSDMTQRPGGSDLYSQAYQSPNLEFICFQAMEWVGGTQYADIVLLCLTSKRTKTSSLGTTMSSTTRPRFQTCMNQNQTCKSYTT